MIADNCNKCKELIEVLKKCRIALVPYVFIDEEVRETLNLSNEMIAKYEGITD